MHEETRGIKRHFSTRPTNTAHSEWPRSGLRTCARCSNRARERLSHCCQLRARALSGGARHLGARKQKLVVDGIHSPSRRMNG